MLNLYSVGISPFIWNMLEFWLPFYKVFVLLKFFSLKKFPVLMYDHVTTLTNSSTWLILLFFPFLISRMTHPGQGLPSALVQDMFGGGNQWTTLEGFGLNLSRKILNMMNGQVNYVREEDKCYFHVELKLRAQASRQREWSNVDENRKIWYITLVFTLSVSSWFPVFCKLCCGSSCLLTKENGNQQNL